MTADPTPLNEAQRRAARHGDGPLLVIAGAGTGKTATVAHRVAHLIEQGAHPGRILLLTFTRRAAAEMIGRVSSLLTRSAFARSRDRRPEQIWGGTFHSVAARLLRLHGRALGLPPTFTILDRSDSEDLINLLRSDLELASNNRRFPLKATCLDIYSRTVNAQEPLSQVIERRFPWCREAEEGLRRLFPAYLEHKQSQDVLDYDDLLLFWRGLLAHSAGGPQVRSRFDWVLVDEYQDTNLVQADILRLLCPGGRGLTVVGDDAQSIYSFRAATVRNILDFPSHYPNTEVVTLEQTYRAPRRLLQPANQVLAEASEAHPKQLWSERPECDPPLLVSCADEQEQAEYVIEQVLAQREKGLSLKQQAVLFRAAHHSLALELDLARAGIPFRKYGGLKFLEAAHVKDVLAFLRLAENPRDLAAGLRVLLLLPGIGPRKARALLQPDGETGLLAGWRSYAPPPAAGPMWTAFVELLETLSRPSPPSLHDQLQNVRDFYAPLLERVHDHAQARMQDVESLVGVASRFEDRARFLAELQLDPPAFSGELAGPPQLDEDYLILTTIHSAKGLEWEAVYLIHAADGNLPSDMACGSDDEIEEERRLFYVALTRARQALHVCVPLRYYTQPRTPFDRYGLAQPSRFLSPAVTACFEQRPARIHGEAAEEGEPAIGLGMAHEIRDGLRTLWG